MSVEIDETIIENPSPLKDLSIFEVEDLDGYRVLLPWSEDVSRHFWTYENAPICYLRMPRKVGDAVTFKIRIGRDFSKFTEKQKLDAIGEIVSNWRPHERISLTYSNFSKEQFDDLVRLYIQSQRK